MESKIHPSSPKVGSTKRGLADELQESPSAKRAKRVKSSKKRRSKGTKGDMDSDGYVEHQDWAEFDNISRSLMAQKETPIRPPTPLPPKQAHKAHVQKSAEKTKDEPKDETAKKAKAKKDGNDSPNGLTVQDSSKAEANTRKTRAEPDSKGNGKAKHAVSNGNSTAPAIPGPSKPTVKKPAQQPKELTPLSDLDFPIDYTFKAFPNPPILKFPAKEDPKKESANEPKKESAKKKSKHASELPIDTVPIDTAPINTNPMDMDIDIDPPIRSPTPDPAMTAPAGTKTLKAINKHLKALEAKLTTTTPDSGSDNHIPHALDALRSDITQLHARLECAELRAAIRHDMLFNALVKVSTDIGVLQGQVQLQQQVDGHNQNQGGGGQNDGADGETVNGTPRAIATAAARDRRGKMMQQSRKTYEQCLRGFTEDMNRAGEREEVEKYGGLCVQYAGDLFKTLG